MNTTPITDPVYWDDELCQAAEVHLPVDSEAVRYGYGAFETILVWNGNPVLLSAHFQRLTVAARELGLVPASLEEGVLGKRIQHLARLRELGTGVARCSLFKVGTKAPLLVAVEPPRPNMSKTFLRVGVERGGRTPLALPGFKSNNYLPSLRALQRAKAEGLDEMLFVGEDGCIGEAATANVFWLNGDHWVTPPLERGILPGVQRQWLLDELERLEMPVVEGPVPLDSVAAGIGLVLTNSLIGVMPVSEIEGQALPTDNPWVEKIRERWRDFLSPSGH